MKVVLSVLDASMGGHTRTAATIGRAIARQGWEVTFLIGAESTDEVLRATSLPVRRLPNDGIGAVRAGLAEIGPVTAIHTFTSLGLAELVAYGAQNRLPVLYTRCGGPAVADGFDRAMLRRLDLPVWCGLSPENAIWFHQSLGVPQDRIRIVPARVDIEELAAMQDRAAQSALCARYGIDPAVPIILRISRVSPAYAEGIIQGARAAQELNRRGIPCQFVHIGHVNVAESMVEVSQTLAKVNGDGRQVAFSIQDESAHAARYLSMAQVTISAGRSLLESCAQGIPAVIVGVNGYAGLADADTMDALGKYNFSGRNIGTWVDRETSIRQLTDALEPFLADSNYAKRHGSQMADRVRDQYDASAGARAYIDLYSSVGPPSMRALAVPVGVARRILRRLTPRRIRLMLSGRRQYRPSRR